MNRIESLFTILISIIAIKPVLKKNLKAFWFLFLCNAFLKTGSLFKKTRWAKRKDKEAQYVKSLLIISAIYLNLAQRFSRDQAMDIMQELVPRLSHAVDYATARKYLLFTIKDPFERWIKYRSILITEGFGLFNTIEDVYINKVRIHYTVKRCIFHDTFAEAGTPELTPLICDYDQSYHSAVFSEFYFDRNGSWKNTIGYGAPLCHYVWKDKNILTEEFRQQIIKKANPDQEGSAGVRHPGSERRKELRRQYDRRQSERRQFNRRNGERRIE